MSLRTALCSLGCLIRGHAPIVEMNECENKSEIVCERCGTVLGDFVVNLKKYGIAPVQRTSHSGLQNGAVHGTDSVSAAVQRADMLVVDWERNFRESVWRDDGGRH
jgi:hypothetical protein